MNSSTFYSRYGFAGTLITRKLLCSFSVTGGVGAAAAGIAAIAAAIGEGGLAVDGAGGISAISGVVLLHLLSAVFLPQMVVFPVLALFSIWTGNYFDGFHCDEVITITAIAAAVAASAERSGSEQCQS